MIEVYLYRSQFWYFKRISVETTVFVSATGAST